MTCTFYEILEGQVDISGASKTLGMEDAPIVWEAQFGSFIFMTGE